IGRKRPSPRRTTEHARGSVLCRKVPNGEILVGQDRPISDCRSSVDEKSRPIRTPGAELNSLSCERMWLRNVASLAGINRLDVNSLRIEVEQLFAVGRYQSIRDVFFGRVECELSQLQVGKMQRRLVLMFSKPKR